MIQFSHRDEKITKLFVTIFWILVGFHIIFGFIVQVIYAVISRLNEYQIADIAHVRYAMALYQWIVS